MDEAARGAGDKPGSAGIMPLSVTLVLVVGLALLALVCGWRGARPPDLRRGPRMIPWRLLMVSAATGSMIFLVHAANLVGINTGR